MKRVGLNTYFTMFITAVMLVAAIDAMSMPSLAGMYPGFIAGVAFLISASQLIHELRKGASSEGALDIERSTQFSAGVRYRKGLKAFIWVMVYYLTILILGFKLGTVAYLAGYLKFEDKAGWIKILIICVSTVMFIEFFREFLGIWWPTGLLGDWLEEDASWLF